MPNACSFSTTHTKETGHQANKLRIIADNEMNTARQPKTHKSNLLRWIRANDSGVINSFSVSFPSSVTHSTSFFFPWSTRVDQIVNASWVFFLLSVALCGFDCCLFGWGPSTWFMGFSRAAHFHLLFEWTLDIPSFLFWVFLLFALVPNVNQVSRRKTGGGRMRIAEQFEAFKWVAVSKVALWAMEFHCSHRKRRGTLNWYKLFHTTNVATDIFHDGLTS